MMRRTSETKNCPRLWEELLAVASVVPVTNNYTFFITGYNQIFHKRWPVQCWDRVLKKENWRHLKLSYHHLTQSNRQKMICRYCPASAEFVLKCFSSFGLFFFFWCNCQYDVPVTITTQMYVLKSVLCGTITCWKDFKWAGLSGNEYALCEYLLSEALMVTNSLVRRCNNAAGLRLEQKAGQKHSAVLISPGLKFTSAKVTAPCFVCKT